MTDMKDMATLFGKIATISGEVDTFDKDAKFSGRGNWKYASAAQVFSVISKVMARHNLACIPHFVEKRETNLYDDGSGNSAQRIEVTFNMILACGDTGATYEVPWQNEVVRYNNDDKVLNKITTISLKYFLMSLFITSQGEADENSTVPPKEQPEPPHWTETPEMQEVQAKLKAKRKEYGDELMDKVLGVVGNMANYDTKGAYYYALGNAFEQERDDEPEPVPEDDTPSDDKQAQLRKKYLGIYVIDLFGERGLVQAINDTPKNTVKVLYADGTTRNLVPEPGQLEIAPDQVTPLPKPKESESADDESSEDGDAKGSRFRSIVAKGEPSANGNGKHEIPPPTDEITC